MTTVLSTHDYRTVRHLSCHVLISSDHVNQLSLSEHVRYVVYVCMYVARTASVSHIDGLHVRPAAVSCAPDKRAI